MWKIKGEKTELSWQKLEAIILIWHLWGERRGGMKTTQKEPQTMMQSWKKKLSKHNREFWSKYHLLGSPTLDRNGQALAPFVLRLTRESTASPWMLQWLLRHGGWSMLANCSPCRNLVRTLPWLPFGVRILMRETESTQVKK